MNSSPFPGMLIVVPFLIWLGVVAFVIAMMWRLVRGVERIAAALERK